MNHKERLWPLFMLIGVIPGMIIWLLFVRLGLAGEFAGCIIGFGAATMFNYCGAAITRRRIVAGSILLLLVAFINNHIAYSMDIYFTFSEEWYGLAGVKINFFDAIAKTWEFMVVRNLEGLRKFYFEAFMQGSLFTLLFWISINVYRKTTVKEVNK